MNTLDGEEHWNLGMSRRMGERERERDMAGEFECRLCVEDADTEKRAEEMRGEEGSPVAGVCNPCPAILSACVFCSPGKRVTTGRCV